ARAVSASGLAIPPNERFGPSQPIELYRLSSRRQARQADLARRAAVAAKQRSVKHEPGPDPRAHGDEKNVSGTPCAPVAVLAKRCEVSLVLEYERTPIEVGAQPVGKCGRACPRPTG